MVVPTIAVDTERLNHDIELLQDRLGITRIHIRELGEQIQSIHRVWEGDAMEKMKFRFESDQEVLKDFCSWMEGFLAHLRTISKGYDCCENHVRNAVDTLSI